MNEMKLSLRSRRDVAKLAVSAAAMMTLAPVLTRPTFADSGLSEDPKVHQFTQSGPLPVNAYIVEGRSGLVVVDATLTNSASRALRDEILGLGKPLRAILLTHPHPDHYAGIGNVVSGFDVPVISVGGVNDVARRDDVAKDQVISSMFGDEWPRNRVFPNATASDGETMVFDELSFEFRSVGPAESFYDSMIILDGRSPTAFIGDLAYGFMHSYMADNTNPRWLKALERLQGELPSNMVLRVGHGDPVTPAILRWQASYLQRFETLMLEADWSETEVAQATVIAGMQEYLPNTDLIAFLELSIMPNAARLKLTP